MNVKKLKLGLVGALVVAVIGATFYQQYLPKAWADNGPKPMEVAKKKGLFKVSPEHRQQAIAWALVDEVERKLGKKRAKEIQEAKTPSELHVYLKRVNKACEKQDKKCPVANVLLKGMKEDSKGVKGKNYGKGIYASAQAYAPHASSCDDPPEPECGVFECLSNWGEHIGACTDECGGMPDRFCGNETTGPDGGSGDDGGGIPDIETPN